MKVDIAGTYRHTKSGKLYQVIDVALHTETGEKMVVYRALYDHAELAGEYGMRPCFVRPYDMFFEDVTIDGTTRPRFEKIDDNAVN